MAEERLKKQRPAGKDENLEIVSTNFAINERQTEMRAEGKDFDNEALLKMLGFQDKDGILTLYTIGHEAVIDQNGKIISRRENGRVLTENEPER